MAKPERDDPMRRGLAFALMLLLCSVPASSHSWYPAECCGDADCRVVKGRALPDGRYLFIDGDRHYVRDQNQVRESRDHDFHLCQPDDPEEDPICFFAPVAGV